MAAYKFKNVSISRSNQMRAIKSKNTTPEMILRKALFKRGLRYRIHYKKLTGKPDIVLVKKKVVIFCDSEFWHGGQNWEDKKNRIKANREYWIPKIEKNIERDKINNYELNRLGWKVLRYWEKDIKKNIEIIVAEIIKVLVER
jgi:DNA mismatch endonuclease (patch repair protein)